MPIKAISVNSSYHANKAHGMTRDAKDWCHSVFWNLSLPGNREALKELREGFNPTKNGYAVDITFGAPREIMFTKAGTLSSRSYDIDNQIKHLIDCIFQPKYFGTNVPYECENLNIDDKHMVRISAQKVAGTGYFIEVTIGYCALP